MTIAVDLELKKSKKKKKKKIETTLSRKGKLNPHNLVNFITPTKLSDGQPLAEREKQFKCLQVEISRS